jgi:hypothetical protein
LSVLYRTIALVAAAALGTTTAIAAQSTGVSPACKPPLDAERKTITTPHHLLSTSESSGSGGKVERSEAISVNGAMYLLMAGTWRRSPITSKDELDQLNSNLASAKAYSCQYTGDGSSGGVPTSVYTAHTENNGVINDARIWVAKGNGLVMRVDSDLNTGAHDKRHLSLAYDYTNVHAPAGVP